MLLKNDPRSGAGGSSDSLHQQDEAGYGKSPEWVEVKEEIFSTYQLEMMIKWKKTFMCRNIFTLTIFSPPPPPPPTYCLRLLCLISTEKWGSSNTGGSE